MEMLFLTLLRSFVPTLCALCPHLPVNTGDGAPPQLRPIVVAFPAHHRLSALHRQLI